MEWRNIYRGLVMGASDVIPGVSGGTIAVLLGFYDQLIASINGLFSKHWRKHLQFLIPLAIGVATSIILLSHIMNWLLTNHQGPTYFFFSGLILGVLPFLFNEAEASKTFRAGHVVLLLLGVLLVGSLVLFNDLNQGVIIVEKSLTTYILLFFSGFLASAAMILPGISGSLVFLILGVYPTIIAAISEFEWITLIVTSIGIFIGIVSTSKVIHYFLSNYRHASFALIIGSVIGSIIVIFPGWPQTTPVLIISIITFSAGLLGAYLLGKVEYKA